MARRSATLTPSPPAGRATRAPHAPDPSSRALLLTILGEHVLPDKGQVWTTTVLEAMAALGVGPGAARQALARTADSGLLEAVRLGRRTRWDLTRRAVTLLREGTERIYHFGLEPVAWDGRWLLVMVTVPESDRHLRQRLRNGLHWAGFAPFGPGTWVSPWVARADEAVRLLASLGLAHTATVFDARLGRLGSSPGVAAAAWDLSALDEAYRTFVASWTAASPSSPAEAFAALTSLVHAWRYFPGADPDLPAELLPAGWSGPEAVSCFHQRHQVWASDARAWWAELTASEAGSAGRGSPGDRPDRPGPPGARRTGPDGGLAGGRVRPGPTDADGASSPLDTGRCQPGSIDQGGL